MSDSSYEIPNDGAVSPDDIKPDAHLKHADLSEANLMDADLSGAHLSEADLSGANLMYADLSEANLSEADLSGAHLTYADLSRVSLWRADLSGAHLTYANLSGVYLRHANLSEADLRHANLSGANLKDADLSEADLRGEDLSGKNLYGVNLIGADLREADLENVRVNGSTQAGKTVRMAVGGRFLFCSHRHRAEAVAESAQDWDAIARSYHDLKGAFSDHGLVSKARDMHFWEQRARGLESKAASDRLNGWITPGYLGSLVSRWLTGYGVRVGRLSLVMIGLLAIGAFVYARGGIEDSVYYSVHTFTTNPPRPLPEDEPSIRLIAMIQTFFGTVLIVLLGYVLGNRERV